MIGISTQRAIVRAVEKNRMWCSNPYHWVEINNTADSESRDLQYLYTHS